MSVNLNVVNITELDLSEEAGSIVENCPTNNITNFAYIGNSTFLYVCGQAGVGFTFVLGNSTEETGIVNFSNIGIGNYYVTSNPIILDNAKIT